MVKLLLPFHEPVYNFDYEYGYLDIDNVLKVFKHLEKILKKKRSLKILAELSRVQNDLDFLGHIEKQKYENIRFEDTIESIIWSDYDDVENEGCLPEWHKNKEFHEGVEKLNSDNEWNMLGKRKDGRYFFFTAYGPWDKNGESKLYVAKKLDTLIEYAMSSANKRDYKNNKSYTYVWK